MRNNTGEPCAWYGDVNAFLNTENSSIERDLRAHHRDSLGMPFDSSQVKAWQRSLEILKTCFQELVGQLLEARSWILIFEYELPRERGRRPDVVLLAGDNILVIEFKGYREPDQAHIDQASAYARDIKHYHAASHPYRVEPVLALAEASDYSGIADDVHLASGDLLPHVISGVVPNQTGEQIDAKLWLSADYAPLPSLVVAARSIFQHDPLPYIRRAYSAGIPETIEILIRAADKAQATRTHHLALVTGVPGSGKTLVGLQFVYHNHFDHGSAQRTAVFLSGNGPLVKVLQHALKSTVFVQDVHGFLRQYGGNQGRTPEEKVIVFDEAQRAWDAQRVQQKRNHKTSEPEDFLRIGSKHDWSLMIGLIGDGQEIHLGEESGLEQWNDAIGATGMPWQVHCPNHVASLFSNAAELHLSDALNLTTSLRTHLAEHVQAWVEQLLHGRLEQAASTSNKIRQQGFDLYITRNLEKAKAYVRKRYHDAEDKRFGLIASSKARNLPKYGVNNSFQYTRRLREGPWYNDPPSSPDSCCQLDEVATEFACQGLELDFPIVCWGNDLTWSNGDWFSPPSPRSQARDPHQLRLNSYRVLLTRGRDGFVVFAPRESRMDSTAVALQRAGVVELA